MDESKSTIMSTKTSTVIFNFQDVPEIDQIGLDFILSIISPLKEKQGTIRLCCATPALKSVLVSAGLVTETDLFPDLSTATHSISKLQVA